MYVYEGWSFFPRETGNTCELEGIYAIPTLFIQTKVLSRWEETGIPSKSVPLMNSVVRNLLLTHALSVMMLPKHEHCPVASFEH
jgi:hypothetical protein